ncbi:MAG TPA: PIN domain-containing protein [Rhizomicrobium sp.]|nr:PIN domain-containing protein [Rhizomicrobium sp.]
MKIALDTNILAYAAGVDDAAKQGLVLDVLEKLPEGTAVVPVQALGELFRVLVRKAKRPAEEARAIVTGWRNSVPTISTTDQVMMSAMELALGHRLMIWDAVILAAAASESCLFLLSEDMHNGFAWGGVTVVNPLRTQLHPLFEEFLAQK